MISRTFFILVSILLSIAYQSSKLSAEPIDLTNLTGEQLSLITSLFKVVLLA